MPSVLGSLRMYRPLAVMTPWMLVVLVVSLGAAVGAVTSPLPAGVLVSVPVGSLVSMSIFT